MHEDFVVALLAVLFPAQFTTPLGPALMGTCDESQGSKRRCAERRTEHHEVKD
ncbi:hypothetical protein BJY00DRAFT_271519 [Aspergillus carlsbadensis]|nr:hypothetical protein BJY00DRAFT_271519 [Aspergillus carlsbadensis]